MVIPVTKQSHLQEWRERWETIAKGFRATERPSDEGDAALIEKILSEQEEAVSRDAAEYARYLRERTGTVAEVATETSYTREYLHELLREGALTDQNPGSRPKKLRYAEVWALKDVPVELADAAHQLPVSAVDNSHNGAGNTEQVTSRVLNQHR